MTGINNAYRTAKIIDGAKSAGNGVPPTGVGKDIVAATSSGSNHTFKLLFTYIPQIFTYPNWDINREAV